VKPRLPRTPAAVAGAVLVAAMIVLAVVGPPIWGASAERIDAAAILQGASAAHPLGTDSLGRDLLARVLVAGRFSLAMEQALAAGDRSGETGSTELYSELGAEGAAIDRLASGLGTDQRTVASLRTANAERFRTVRVGHAKLGGAEAYGDYDTTITSLQGSVDQELAAAADAARRAALVSAAVTVAALIAAVALAYVVSLLLLGPIRRVREGALAVAREQLPDEVARIRSGEEPGDITPIGVRTGEEIGQLARAVDDLHRQAVVLASGEAALRSQVSQMFVTLSRRNTNVRSLDLSLREKPPLTAACDESLRALQQLLAAEGSNARR